MVSSGREADRMLATGQYRLWVYGMLGATMAGWGVTLVIHRPEPIREAGKVVVERGRRRAGPVVRHRHVHVGLYGRLFQRGCQRSADRAGRHSIADDAEELREMSHMKQDGHPRPRACGFRPYHILAMRVSYSTKKCCSSWMRRSISSLASSIAVVVCMLITLSIEQTGIRLNRNSM